MVNSQDQTMVRDQLGDEWYANITEMVGKGGKVGLKDKVKEFVQTQTTIQTCPSSPNKILESLSERY
jgi:hypothetical protein